MKKAVVVLLAGMAAVGAQAAVMNWGTQTLLDTGSGRGYDYNGTLYAVEGVDLYLVYNGVQDATPLGEVTYENGALQFGGDLVAQFTTTGADYATGGAQRPEDVPGLDWLGDISGNWDDMNLRTFSIIAVSDDDGDYAAGAWYGTFTGNPVNFSNATAGNSIATFNAGTLDSGAAALVPEPATFGLMGIAGLGMFLARKKARR